MVQILAPGRQKQSIAQRLAKGVGAGLESAENLYQKKEAESRLQQENEAAKRLGIDLSGISNPKMREQALAETLKGQTEAGKYTRKQELIDQFLGKRSTEDVSKGEMLTSEGKQKEKQFDPSTVSDEDILRAYQIDHDLGHALEVQKESALREKRENTAAKRKEFESDREFNSKRSDPIIEAAQNYLKESEISKALSQESRRAVESGNVEGIAPFLISKLGFDPATPPDMATFISAQKHSFMSDLKGMAAGARLNQFLEKILSSALPTVGRPKDANLNGLDLEDFIRDMKTKRAETELSLADEDFKKYGYAKADIARRATEIMNDYVESAMDKLAYNIRNRHVSGLSDDQLAQEIARGDVTTDQPLTQREAKFIYLKNGGDVKATNLEIRKKGYKIPKKSTYEGF